MMARFHRRGVLAALTLSISATSFLIRPSTALAQSEPDGAKLDQAELDRVDWAAEYERSWYLDQIRAGEAYQRGYTGKGITIGVVDTGLDKDDREFQGRVSPLSTGYMTPDFSDVPIPGTQVYHGTFVSGLAAAARDGRGMMGVGYEATLLMSKMEPPDFAENVPIEASTEPLVTAARLGANVVSVSYGDNYYPVIPGSAVLTVPTFQLKYLKALGNTALDATRINQDAVFVFAAGNETWHQPIQAKNPVSFGFFPLVTPENLRAGLFRVIDDEKTADVNDPSTYHYLSPDDPRIANYDLSELNRRIIAVVGSDRRGKIAGFSNRCGLAWQWCLTAPAGDKRKEARWKARTISRTRKRYFPPSQTTNISARPAPPTPRPSSPAGRLCCARHFPT